MSLREKRSIPSNINAGLSSPPNRLMLELLGSPRNSYDQSCRPPTNTSVKKLIRLRDVGPFRVTGLEPAVESLAAIMADIKVEQPDVYAALGSMGMLCCPQRARLQLVDLEPFVGHRPRRYHRR